MYTFRSIFYKTTQTLCHPGWYLHYYAARMINFTRRITLDECIARRMDELYPIHAYNQYLNHQASYSLSILGLMMLFLSVMACMYTPNYGDFILWLQCSVLCFILSAVTHIVMIYTPHEL